MSKQPKQRAAASLAVIHMGPRKTGSTSIQKVSADRRAELLEDGYEMPWVAYPRKLAPPPNSKNIIDRPVGKLHRGPNGVCLAKCFVPHIDREGYPCSPDLLLSVQEIAHRGSNLLVSAEHFDGADLSGLATLSAVLAPWESKTIIVYYRRFYDWIRSFHNQHVKSRTFDRVGLSGTNLRKWELTFLDYMDLHWGLQGGKMNNNGTGTTAAAAATKNNAVWKASKVYTPNLIERLRTAYADDPSIDLVVMDFHDPDIADHVEGFYCRGLPRAPRTCETVRENSSSNNNTNNTNNTDDDDRTVHLNPSDRSDLVYGDLSYAAHRSPDLNFTIRSDAHMRGITAYIRNHYEEILGKTHEDFPRVCPSAELYERFLTTTLESEKTVFPGTWEDRVGAVVSDFRERVLPSELLCVVDIPAVMLQDDWKKLSRTLRDWEFPPP